MTVYVWMSLTSLALASICTLLLLILLKHAFIDLIAFKNLSLTPLLQLALHFFAHAHVQGGVDWGRVSPLIYTSRNVSCIWTLRKLVFVWRRTKITTSIINNSVNFALFMAIGSTFYRLNRRYTWASLKLQWYYLLTRLAVNNGSAFLLLRRKWRGKSLSWMIGDLLLKLFRFYLMLTDTLLHPE